MFFFCIFLSGTSALDQSCRHPVGLYGYVNLHGSSIPSTRIFRTRAACQVHAGAEDGADAAAGFSPAPACGNLLRGRFLQTCPGFLLFPPSSPIFQTEITCLDKSPPSGPQLVCHHANENSILLQFGPKGTVMIGQIELQSLGPID